MKPNALRIFRLQKMLRLIKGCAFLLASVLCFGLSHASPFRRSPSEMESPTYTVFTSESQDDVSLRFVQNFGICETTPGVQQMSGYIDIGTNMSMVCDLLPHFSHHIIHFTFVLSVVLVFRGPT